MTTHKAKTLSCRRSSRGYLDAEIATAPHHQNSGDAVTLDAD